MHSQSEISSEICALRCRAKPVVFCLSVCYFGRVGAWLSLVERTVRVREVGGSNPLAPTISFHLNYYNLSLFCVVLIAQGFVKGSRLPSKSLCNCSFRVALSHINVDHSC